MSTTAKSSPTRSSAAAKAASSRAASAKKRATDAAGTGKRPSRSSAARRPTANARTSSASGKRPSTRTSSTASNPRTVGDYAESAVLIPVGAALLARDRLVAGVGELPRYRSSAAAKAQLRRFERRGASARNSLEREARRTKVRLERELRRRRRSLEGTMNEIDKHRASISRSITGQVEETQDQIERAVQARVKDATTLAEKVQDRFLDLV